MGALRDVPLRKLASAGAVIVLHVFVLALWLSHADIHRIAMPRETILYLPPLPKPAASKPAAPPRAPRPAVHLSPSPDTRVITVPTFKDDAVPAMPGLGRSLFACRPENFANLSPEEQAACASASNGVKPNLAPDFRDHSDRVAGAALWARQKARKNGPLLLPCASPNGINPIGTALCLGGALINGVKPDEQPIYGDKPQDVHVPNGGDPHPDYTDPDH
ncbi:MAG TPA: hypothetical protein VFV07_03140 [Rhizomicrobium sp.]|nr:hypothetical protein [Rhizomicrobium sp.]